MYLSTSLFASAICHIYEIIKPNLLPKLNGGVYRQMPYEEITEKEYNKMVKKLGYLSFRQVKGNEAIVDKFCNNDTCEIDFLTSEKDT